jgi:hypothetical protein
LKKNKQLSSVEMEPWHCNQANQCLFIVLVLYIFDSFVMTISVVGYAFLPSYFSENINIRGRLRVRHPNHESEIFASLSI